MTSRIGRSATIVSFAMLVFFSMGSSRALAAPAKPADSAKISDVKFLALADLRAPKSPGKGMNAVARAVSVIARAGFVVAILGENLPCPAPTGVLFVAQDAGHAVEVQSVACPNTREIDVSGEARVGTVIDTVTVADTGGKAVSSQDLKISIQPTATASALREFTVTLDHQPSKEFPSLHTLLVTRQSGDDDVGFAANPNRMRIEVEPTGATDVRVVQSNLHQLELHFVAAADYVPMNVVVTVYDGTDLDKRQPSFVARLASPSTDKDPNAPTITSTETVFLDRHEGNGRIRLYGKGFGKFPAPPLPVDDFLCTCLERPPLEILKYDPVTGTSDWSARPRPCGDRGKTFYAETAGLKGSERSQQRDKKLLYQEHGREGFCAQQMPAWLKWQETLGVVAGVTGRNPDIRVEKVLVLSANDGMVDVYFEFTRYHGYAWPFRFAGVDLAVQKKVEKIEQSVPAGTVSGEIVAVAPASFTVSSSVGPAPDSDLAFRYTVLDRPAARHLLGEGVADNFYVVQLSVVNNGKKKVAVPLAAIQAEVEWLYGKGDTRTRSANAAGDAPGSTQHQFIEGPATLAPIPLAAVSAYFGTYQKVEGRRAKVFSILEGVATLATALVPFAGPSFKDGQLIFSNGIIAGLNLGWVDLSAQQLQNLTALSWETNEVLPASGGSMEKYVYIQRTAQFQDDEEETTSPHTITMKKMSNITGFELIGYEISDSVPKQATSGGNKPATATTAGPAPTIAPAPAAQ